MFEYPLDEIMRARSLDDLAADVKQQQQDVFEQRRRRHERLWEVGDLGLKPQAAVLTALCHIGPCSRNDLAVVLDSRHSGRVEASQCLDMWNPGKTWYKEDRLVEELRDKGLDIQDYPMRQVNKDGVLVQVVGYRLVR